MAVRAQDNGWAGLVILGAVRDTVALAEVAVGVQALGTHPRKSGRAGKGAVGVPVSFGCVTFTPGALLHAGRRTGSSSCPRRRERRRPAQPRVPVPGGSGNGLTRPSPGDCRRAEESVGHTAGQWAPSPGVARVVRYVSMASRTQGLVQ